MKRCEKNAKRIISLLFSFVLVLGSMPSALLFASTDAAQTQADAISAQAEEGVTLKEGNYAEWIDRLADLPDYALEFYDWLIENTDGDGVDDMLIDPTTATLDSGDYIQVVGELTETIPCPVDDVYDTANVSQVGTQLAREAASANFDEAADYLAAVYCAFDRDHPEVFWLSGRHGYMSSWNIEFVFKNGSWEVVLTQSFYMTLVTSSVNVIASEYSDPSDIYANIAVRDEAVDTILDGVKGTTRLEQIQYLNQWLTEHNCYNSSSNLSSIASDCRSCISALTGCSGSTGPVCEGYARAFKVLCDELDIPCVLVDGEATSGSGGGAHMWNYVQMDDGKWYAVDVTWNDPKVSGASDPNATVSGYEREDYLLVGSSTVIGGLSFGKSHEVENIVGPTVIAFTNGPILEEKAYAENADLFDLYGANMNLGNSLDMNFFIEKAGIAEGTEYYVKIVKSYADGRADVVKTIASTDWLAYGNYYYVTFEGISAKEMNDEITVQVFYGETDKAASTLWTDSIRKYAERMLPKSTADTERTLYVNMLNYGAEAQEFFEYGADELANEGIDAYQSYAIQTVTYENEQVKGEGYLGSSLVLKNTLILAFAFNDDLVGSDDYAIVTFTDHRGVEKSVRIEGSDFVPNISANVSFVYVDAQKVADGRQLIACTVYDSDGRIITSASDSIESYVARNAAKEPFYKSILEFSDAAYAYLHR